MRDMFPVSFIGTILYPPRVINPDLEFKWNWLENELATGQLRAQWDVPATLAYLEGHFPEFPVVPGVALLDATVEALKNGLSQDGLELKRVYSAKFLRPVTPGLRLQIQLFRIGNERWKAQWTEAEALWAEFDLEASSPTRL